MGVHKTVNGAYRYSLMPTYYVKGCSPLALPLGELSPQVTERVLQSFLINWYGHWLPSPSSLRSATSPKGRGKGCSHGTPKGVEVRPLSVRQIGVYCIVPTYYFV